MPRKILGGALFDLFPLLDAHRWMNSPFFLFPASFLIVYLIGWAISFIKRAIASWLPYPND